MFISVQRRANDSTPTGRFLLSLYVLPFPFFFLTPLSRAEVGEKDDGEDEKKRRRPGETWEEKSAKDINI